MIKDQRPLICGGLKDKFSKKYNFLLDHDQHFMKI